jgi:hypothetical protein
MRGRWPEPYRRGMMADTLQLQPLADSHAYNLLTPGFIGHTSAAPEISRASNPHV